MDNLTQTQAEISYENGAQTVRAISEGGLFPSEETFVRLAQEVQKERNSFTKGALEEMGRMLTERNIGKAEAN